MAKDRFYSDDPNLPELPLFRRGATRDEQVQDMVNFSNSVRDTSLGAYRDHKGSGGLSKQARKLYEILMASETPMSLREIQKVSGVDINAVSGRVNDMKKVGLIIECMKRKCSVTGRMVIPVAVL